MSTSTDPNALTLERSGTAVLLMDLQHDIVEGLPDAARERVLENAGGILTLARGSGVPVIHVAVRFRAGYPEVAPRNLRFARIREAGRLQEGTPGAEVHARVAPVAGEVVVSKRRVGAFSTTELDAVLRAKGIHTLVLLGVSTSGVVLSTLCWAADLDYGLVVVEDACADADEELHRVLMEKVFPKAAQVVSAQTLMHAL